MNSYRDFGHDRDAAPMIGHACQGGGAEINNSPITVNIHITISEGLRLEDDTGRPTDAARALGFLARLFRGSDHQRDGGGQGHSRLGSPVVVDLTDRELISMMDGRR